MSCAHFDRLQRKGSSSRCVVNRTLPVKFFLASETRAKDLLLRREILFLATHG